jgi:DNA-binding NarL/FixJ family response regulator
MRSPQLPRYHRAARRRNGPDTGTSDWEIGEILTLSRRTFAKHSQAILQKLAPANRTQAVAIALRENIIAP